MDSKYNLLNDSRYLDTDCRSSDTDSSIDHNAELAENKEIEKANSEPNSIRTKPNSSEIYGFVFWLTEKHLRNIRNIPFFQSLKDRSKLAEKIRDILMHIWDRFINNEGLKGTELKKLLEDQFGEDQVKKAFNNDFNHFKEVLKHIKEFLVDAAGIYPLIRFGKNKDPDFMIKIHEESSVPLTNEKKLDRRYLRSADKIVDVLKRNAQQVLAQMEALAAKDKLDVSMIGEVGLKQRKASLQDKKSTSLENKKEQ